MTARLFTSIPELAATSVAGFSLGPMILLLSGHFSAWPVIATGLLGALIAGWLCDGRGAPSESEAGVAKRRAWLWTLAAVVLVIGWVLVNVGKTAENVYATRDPATYNITARWLMDEPSLHINTQPELFGAPNGYISESAGFSDDDQPGQVYSQGNHLMPALAAVLGWATGIQGMFRADLVLGGLALLALFGLARRVVGPGLALLVTAAMAVSLPMVYVSRDMYSEPLMMIFLMGGVALLHRAVKYGRRIDYGLAGYVSGCSALVRIDSYAALLAVIVSGIVVVALAAPRERRQAAGNGITMVVAGAVPAFVGWLDVTRLSYGYYRDQHHHILMEFAAALGLLVLAPLIVWFAWRPGVRARLAPLRGRLATVTSVLLVATFVMLLSRPLWYTGRWPFNHTLATWQALDGVQVDGTRDYREQTINWLGAYLGWPAVLLAVGGYVLLVQALLRRREYPLIGVLALGLTMSALYLWNPQITPDLPWAMRRFVPVVLPMLLIAAAVAIRALMQRGGGWRPIGVLLGVFVVALPAQATWPVRDVREAVPQYAQVKQICKAVGTDGAVVMIDVESLNGYAQTVRSYCHVPSMGLVAPSLGSLVEMRAEVARHNRTLYVMARDKAGIPFAPGVSTEPFSSVKTQLWPNVINRVPTEPTWRPTDVYLGTVDDEGLFRPLPGAG